MALLGTGRARVSIALLTVLLFALAVGCAPSVLSPARPDGAAAKTPAETFPDRTVDVADFPESAFAPVGHEAADDPLKIEGASSEPIAQDDDLTTRTIRFASPAGGEVTGDLTVPTWADGKLPCVVALHGIGGNRITLNLGWAAPRPLGMGVLSIDSRFGHETGGDLNPDSWATKDEVLASVEVVLADLGAALEVLVKTPECDSERLGFVGMSLGGVIGSIFIASEPRIRFAALALMGGEIEDVLRSGVIPAVSQAHRLNLDAFAESLSSLDPAKWAPLFGDMDVLYISSEDDPIFGESSQEAFESALAVPPKREVISKRHSPGLSDLEKLSISINTWVTEIAGGASTG